MQGFSELMRAVASGATRRPVHDTPADSKSRCLQRETACERSRGLRHHLTARVRHQNGPVERFCCQGAARPEPPSGYGQEHVADRRIVTSRRDSTVSRQRSPDRRSIVRESSAKTDRLHTLDAASRGRTEVEDADAVLGRLHHLDQCCLQMSEFDTGEITDEERVLERVAVILGNAMDSAESTWVTNVIGEQVASSLGHRTFTV